MHLPSGSNLVFGSRPERTDVGVIMITEDEEYEDTCDVCVLEAAKTVSEMEAVCHYQKESSMHLV